MLIYHKEQKFCGMTKYDEEKKLFRLSSREYQYPNSIGTEHDYDGPGRGGIVYYKDDVERMKDMTTEEMIAYKYSICSMLNSSN